MNTTTIAARITARYAAKGTTGDVTECECCGKRGLRKTVLIVALDADGNPNSDVAHYGTGCAARATGTTTARITAAAKTADARRTKTQALYDEYGTRMAAAADRGDMTAWHAIAAARGRLAGELFA